MPEQKVTLLPLQDQRILVTRTRNQASVLCEKLRTLGAVPIEFPTIRIVPPQDWNNVDAALKRLYGMDSQGTSFYDWAIFTSVNGVNSCFERLRVLGYDQRKLHGVRIAAIGPATGAALASYGLTADLIPNEYVAEGVVAALLEDAQQHHSSIAGQRILLARAAEARKVLAVELQKAGALVDEVPVYYTVTVQHDDERGREVLYLLQNRQINTLTFTSSSTVRNFVGWLESCEDLVAGSPLELVTQQPQLSVACIGPITSRTARELGLHVDIEAKEFTIDGLVKAMVQYEEKV